MRRATCLLLVALASCLQAQEIASTTADSTKGRDIDWTQRLVRDRYEQGIRNHLVLFWDEWHHSDLTYSPVNPMAPADLRIGAVWLDGSLGLPILSAAIPSIVSVSHAKSFPVAYNLIFNIGLPEGKSRGSYFHWEQGNFQFNNVEIGAAAAWDSTRQLIFSAQTQGHRGANSLSGPSPSNPDGSALQNYVIDYKVKRESYSYEYTLSYQKEALGLPYIDEDSYANTDRRTGKLWSQGIVGSWAGESFRLEGNASESLRHTRTKTRDSDSTYLNIRILSRWINLAGNYHLVGNLALAAAARLKQRLGYPVWQSSGTSAYHGYLEYLGTGLTGRAGLSLIDGRFAPMASLGITGNRIHLAVRLESASTLTPGAEDFVNRTIYPAVLPPPLMLTHRVLEAEGQMDRGSFNLLAGHVTAEDTVAGWVGQMGWDIHILRDVTVTRGSLNWHIPVKGSPPVPRLTGLAELTLTPPLKRSRARPFASVALGLQRSDFAIWINPRYGGLYPIPPVYDESISFTMWLNWDIGVKAKNFEVRYHWFNATGVSIENSPVYSGPAPLGRLSITWLFD